MCVLITKLQALVLIADFAYLLIFSLAIIIICLIIICIEIINMINMTNAKRVQLRL